MFCIETSKITSESRSKNFPEIHLPQPRQKGLNVSTIFGFLTETRERYILWKDNWKKKILLSKISTTFVHVIVFVSVTGIAIESAKDRHFFYLKNFLILQS